ncbi:hypothetical protein SEA_NICEHOUSE_284 [Rhodococcus phage NiceHouse]|nr:hypothetical protein SEA_NICEHOUSE_3 [Rhodococcus phage NiceHouse]QLF83497.1 hypothetical protein SEA_NICEHOUSE_284 [Rhodococcus phage NiceHouse]
MANRRYVEQSVDSDGFIIDGYTVWDCDVCGTEIRRYRGTGDQDCYKCGACYNAGGQRLRDDWRNNPSNYDDNIGDLEGYELEHEGDY